MPVKPILKKLASPSKASIASDPRSWGDQDGVDASAKGFARGARDVSFQSPLWEHSGSQSAFTSGTTTPVGDMATDLSVFDGGMGSRSASRGRFQHARSPSGTSIGTNGSSNRYYGAGAGAFVHPFQQTPRTETPPIYLGSYGDSSDNDEGDDRVRSTAANATVSPQTLSSSRPLYVTHSNPRQPTTTSTLQTSGFRRPSLVSQRSNSFADATSPLAPAPPPRAQTLHQQPSRTAIYSSSSRFGRDNSSILSTSYSQSDLRLVTSAAGSRRPSFTNPTSSISPVRGSLDSMGFRLRSQSEVVVDGGIREARRKFQEHERLKEEKYEAEQSRKRDRKDTKEAAKLEKAARKNTFGSDTGRSSFSRSMTPVTSSSSRHESPLRGDGNKPLSSRGNELTRKGTTSSTLSLTLSGAGCGMDEKTLQFQSTRYNDANQGKTPTTMRPEDAPRNKQKHGAKRKTQTVWQAFLLWFRTRLLQLERR